MPGFASAVLPSGTPRTGVSDRRAVHSLVLAAQAVEVLPRPPYTGRKWASSPVLAPAVEQHGATQNVLICTPLPMNAEGPSRPRRSANRVVNPHPPNTGPNRSKAHQSRDRKARAMPNNHSVAGQRGTLTIRSSPLADLRARAKSARCHVVRCERPGAAQPAEGPPLRQACRGAGRLWRRPFAVQASSAPTMPSTYRLIRLPSASCVGFTSVRTIPAKDGCARSTRRHATACSSSTPEP